VPDALQPRLVEEAVLLHLPRQQLVVVPGRGLQLRVHQRRLLVATPAPVLVRSPHKGLLLDVEWRQLRRGAFLCPVSVQLQQAAVLEHERVHVAVTSEVPHLAAVAVLRIGVQRFLVVLLDVPAVARPAPREAADQAKPQVYWRHTRAFFILNEAQST